MAAAAAAAAAGWQQTSPRLEVFHYAPGVPSSVQAPFWCLYQPLQQRGKVADDEGTGSGGQKGEGWALSHTLALRRFTAQLIVP